MRRSARKAVLYCTSRGVSASWKYHDRPIPATQLDALRVPGETRRGVDGRESSAERFRSFPRGVRVVVRMRTIGVRGTLGRKAVAPGGAGEWLCARHFGFPGARSSRGSVEQAPVSICSGGFRARVRRKRWRRSRAARLTRTRDEVRHADADPAGDAAGRRRSRCRAASRPTTTRSRCGSSSSRSCRRACRATTVWGYGAVKSASKQGPAVHNAPSLTIEAKWKRPVRVKWINDLMDANGNYLPHLLPVDPTLHWANPPGGTDGRDTRPTFDSTPGPYTGPVPIVTHLHGAVGVGDESDGYAEAWYLPAAANIPAGYATEGTWYDFFAGKAASKFGVDLGPGVRDLPVPQRPARVDAVVPRPRARHDPAERVRRPGRLLPRPRRPRGRQGDPGQPHRHDGRAARPGAQGGRRVPAQQDLLRDPDRGPGPLVQRPTARCSTPTRGRSSTASPDPYIPETDSRRSGTPSSSATRSWSTATPGRSRRGAAPLPAPLPQRLPVALPDPRLQQHPRRRGLADRQRGRLPGGAGEPHRRPTATGC